VKSVFDDQKSPGRVSVVASDDEKTKPACQATSAAARLSWRRQRLWQRINVRETARTESISLCMCQSRSRVRIESETGMVEVIGDFETARG